MKPRLELPGPFRSQADFEAELGALLSQRNFFYTDDGRFVHLVEIPPHGLQFVDVTPQYLAEYVNREFETVEAASAP